MYLNGAGVYELLDTKTLHKMLSRRYFISSCNTTEHFAICSTLCWPVSGI
jgi:hypothetical protein